MLQKRICSIMLSLALAFTLIHLSALPVNAADKGPGFEEDAGEAADSAATAETSVEEDETAFEDTETAFEDTEAAFEDAETAFEDTETASEDTETASEDTEAVFEAAADASSEGAEYGVSICSADGKIVVFPGEEIVLEANAWRSQEGIVSSDSLLYKWEIVDGNTDGYVSIKDGLEGSIGDYPSVTLEFSGNPDPEICDLDSDAFKYIVTVRVTVYDGTDENGDPIERISADLDGIALLDEYFEIRPLKIDQIEAGDTRTVSLAILYASYYLGNDLRYGDHVSWTFEYDDSVLELRDADGNLLDGSGGTPFVPGDDVDEPQITITRLTGDAGYLKVTAEFGYTDHNGSYHGNGGSSPRETFSAEYHFQPLEEGGNGLEEGGNGQTGDENLWLDVHDNRVFSDGDRSWPLILEGLPEGAVQGTDYDLSLAIGPLGDDGIQNFFTEGVEYSFDGSGPSLTLHGSQLAAAGLADDEEFGAEISLLIGGETVRTTGCRFRFCQPRADYDREYDRWMMPGWDGTVNGSYHVYSENSQYPDGNDASYRVTNVEIESDQPAEGADGSVITDFHRDEEEGNPDNYWWYYRVENFGAAILRVTYEDLEGQEESYAFEIHVGSHVYDVHMDSFTGERVGLPGAGIELYADASHQYLDEMGDQQFTAEGMGYEWSFEHGGQYASINVNEEDPSRALLTFHSLPEGEDWIDEDIRVAVKVLDEEGNETPAQDSTGFRVSSDYTQIWPAVLAPGLDVGKSLQDQKFEVRSYRLGNEGYEVIDPSAVTYRWHFDDNAIQITESGSGEGTSILPGEDTSGDTFTITRRRGWHTDYNLEAVWEDDGRELGANWSYRLNQKDYNFRLTSLDDNRVFSDEEDRSWPFVIEGLPEDAVFGSDYRIVCAAGPFGDHGVIPSFAEGAEYSLDGNSLTFHGDKIAESGLVDDNQEFGAEISLEIGEETYDTDYKFRFRKAWTEYDREYDRDMLPGWDGTVDGSYHVHSESSQYPDGYDTDYRVTNVEVIDDQPAEGADGAVVTDFHRDQNENDPDDYWWYYRVENPGAAVLRVTYEDLEGQEASYTFELHVGSNVYKVHLDSVTGAYDGLPGTGISLHADAFHEYLDAQGDYHNTSDGLDYIWSIESGNAFAQIAVDDERRCDATLTFYDLPDGTDEIDEEIRVLVKVLDEEGNETGIQDMRSFWVHSQYEQIWPAILDPQLDMGNSLDEQTFTVRRYTAGKEGFEVLDEKYDIRYKWHFDENAIQITAAKDGGSVRVSPGEEVSGNAFQITRLKNWNTDYSLEAIWEEKNHEERHAWSNYHFADKDYRIPFYSEEDTIRDDEEKTFALDTESLGSLDHDIVFWITYRTAEGEGRECFDTMTEGLEFQVDPSGGSITVDGDLAERTLSSDAYDKNMLYITASLFHNGEELWQSVCKVNLERTEKEIQAISADDVSMTMVQSPTISVAGAQGTLTFSSANESVVKVDAATGKLTPVAPGTAEILIKAAPTGEYRHGKTSLAVTVTRADLSTASITTNAPSKGYAYNGKSQKPSVTVICDGVTLTSGSDYKITWPSDLINAGAKTITVKAAGSRTQGTNTVTYKINKAAQTLTYKVSASKIAVDKSATSAVSGAKGTKTFTSANATIASVNTTTGKITAKKVGTVKIKVTAKATSNYSAASEEITVKVVPAATTSLTAANQAAGIKLTWKKVTGATGYLVYRDSTRLATIKSGSTVTYTDKKAANGTKYTYKVIATASTGNSTLNKTCAACFVTRPAISSAANTAAQKMTVKWGKNSKATGYQIQYSTSKAFSSGNKTVTVTGASTVSRAITGLAKGKTYYIRLRTYKTVGSAKYYSAWSPVRTLKITK